MYFSYMVLRHLELAVTLLLRFCALGPMQMKKTLHEHCLSHAEWKGETGRYTPWNKAFAQKWHMSFSPIFHWPKQCSWWNLLSVGQRRVEFCKIMQSIKSPCGSFNYLSIFIPDKFFSQFVSAFTFFILLVLNFILVIYLL